MIYKLPNLENLDPDFGKKTTMYVIRCKDENIPGCYVGATKDFNARKSQHKHDTNDLSHGGPKRKLYTAIRANGGFENYTISPIETYPRCQSTNDSRIRERELFDIYRPELNSYRPYISDAERPAIARETARLWRANHKVERAAYDAARYAAKKDATPLITTTTKTTTIKTTTTTTTETTTIETGPTAPII